MKNAGIILLSLILIINATGCGEDSGGISNPVGDLVLGAATVAGTATVLYVVDRMLNDPPVIKTIEGPDTIMAGKNAEFSVIAFDPGRDTLTYTWAVDKGQLSQTSGHTVTWTAPNTVGKIEIEVRISDGVNKPVSQSKTIIVTENPLPIIDTLTIPDTVEPGESVQLQVVASDPSGETLTYMWKANGGRLNKTSSDTATWTAPNTEGDFEIEIQISDGINEPLVRSKTIKVAKIKPLKLGMAKIPAGVFLMGSNDGDDDEKPVHTVYLDEFYIDKYEVTNEQYARFLNAIGKNEDAAGHELLDLNGGYSLIEEVGITYRPKSGYENHPVILVSWYGAAAYAQWAGKRLPTEAQWEKAARGGLVGKKYPWGDTITHNDANYFGTGGKDRWNSTSPVGSFAPNGYGLYDMAGNVWEWCADEYDSGYYSKNPRNNPEGPGVAITFKNDIFTKVNPSSRRVLRGGSWFDVTSFLRCARRISVVPADAFNFVGFRCSQDF